MNRNIMLGLLILLAGGLAGWYLFSGKPTPKLPSFPQLTQKASSPPTPTVAMTDEVVRYDDGTGDGGDKGGVAARTVVTYTDTGFGPASIIVKQGTMVAFVNESGKGMWVASDVHPTHQLLSGFDQKASVGKDGVYEYAFVKVGTWRYHNHINPADAGAVVVTE